MPSGTKINGVVHSFQTITASVSVLNKAFENLEELNYKDSLEPGKRRGRSGKVTGRTHGDYDAEADISLPKEDSHELIQSLASKNGGDGFGLVTFDIEVVYSDGDGPTITDTIRGCRIKENDASNSKGSDQTLVKHSLDAIEILWGGKRMSNVGG